MSTISLGRSGIVGISYKETSLLKSSLKRASEKNNIAINKINRAKLNLQVDRGSSRIRIESDNLQSLYRKLKNYNTDIEKVIKDIDYIVRRFKEVDNKCANKVKLLRTGLKVQKSASKIGSSLISLGDKVVKRTSSFINDGFNAAKTMYTKASNWVEKHPLAMNALSALLNTAVVVGTVVSVAGTIAAAVASAPVTLTVGAVVGVVGAVIGGVLALNGLINDGVKIFNNVKNGNNKGFDPIKSGLEKLLGKKTGDTVYSVVNVVDLALSFPHAMKGLGKAGSSLIEAGKSIKNTIKELPEIIRGFKGTAINYMDEVADVFRKVTGLEPQLAGIAGATLDDIKAIGKIKIDDVPELNDLQKNYNKIVNAGKGAEGAVDAEKGILRIEEIAVDFNYNSKYDEAEFARQLADQEAGMNQLTIEEYLKNRERYIAEGRAIEGNAAQQAARKEALANKVDELLDSGMSFQEAEKQAEKWLDSQAALHNPDQIAGGNPLNIGGMGDKKINSSIGSQWRYRIDMIDEQIRALAETMTDEEKKSTYLNVKLKYLEVS